MARSLKPGRLPVAASAAALVVAVFVVVIAYGGKGEPRASAPEWEAAVVPEGRGRPGGIRWRGDFERGTFGQWTKVEAVPEGATIQRRTVRQGAFAARFRVGPGDVPGRSGERAELVLSQALTAGYEGVEAWYAWSTFFPPSFNPVPNSTWNIFTQWHETNPDGCRPNLALHVNTKQPVPRIRLQVRGGGLDVSTCAPGGERSWDTVPLEYGRWYDFVAHVRWSSELRSGFVQLWIDGKEVVPKTPAATLYVGQGVYLKQGFYRAPDGRVSTIFHDAARRGTSFAAVGGP